MTNESNQAELMDEEQFAAFLEKRLSLHEDQIELQGRNGTVIALRARDQNVSFNAASFYRAYAEHPEQLDAIARTVVRVLTTEAPKRTEQSYDALSTRIYPMLKPIELLANVRERKLPMIVYREFLADLIVTYVVDEENSVTYINEQHLERWELSAQDIHEQAIVNLRRRTLELTDYVSTGEGEGRLFIFNSQDGYDATRLLLGDVLSGWARQLPGNLVIGIPNRDFLIAFSDANDEILRNVAHQVQADSAQRENGLTEQLFTLSRGQVREYQWN